MFQQIPKLQKVNSYTNNILNKYIHNQSYIYLKIKYTKLVNNYNNLYQIEKNNKIKIKDLQNKIVQLESKNNNLLKENKYLNSELFQKTKFYNFNAYKRSFP